MELWRWGRIRLEAFQQSLVGSLTVSIDGAPVSFGSPSNLVLPSAPTSVRVVSVAGVAVNQSPTGSFQLPDVTINSGVPVLVSIEAKNIPPGTVVKLQLFSENGTDQFVDSTALAGTLQLSTATASVVFPTGFTRGFVRATWMQ